jgi:hypothetical protein
MFLARTVITERKECFGSELRLRECVTQCLGHFFDLFGDCFFVVFEIVREATVVHITCKRLGVLCDCQYLCPVGICAILPFSERFKPWIDPFKHCARSALKRPVISPWIDRNDLLMSFETDFRRSSFQSKFIFFFFWE